MRREPVLTTNIEGAWNCHTGPTFRHCEHSIQCRCVSVLRKQRETGQHTFMLLTFRKCLIYSLAQLESLHYAVQFKSNHSNKNLEAFGKLSTRLIVFLHYCYIQCLIIEDMGPSIDGDHNRRADHRILTSRTNV